MKRSIINQILKWIFQSLRLKKTVYPPELKNKTRADYIEKMKKMNGGKH